MYLPPNFLVTFPFVPDLEAGFSRSGVGDLVSLDDVVHFRETRKMSQANKPNKMLARTISFVTGREGSELWRVSIDMVIELYKEQGIEKDYDSLTEDIITNF